MTCWVHRCGNVRGERRGILVPGGPPSASRTCPWSRTRPFNRCWSGGWGALTRWAIWRPSAGCWRAWPSQTLNRDQDGIARLLAHPEGRAGEAPTPGLVLLQAALAWHYDTTQQVQQHLRMAERVLEQARLFHAHTVLLQAQRVYGLALHYLGRYE